VWTQPIRGDFRVITPIIHWLPAIPISKTTATPIRSSRAFGSAKELHALVNLAHSQGIRVIPDFVANHVHKEANIYQQNKDWFHPYNPCHENWGTHRVDCWFTTDMPDFDYQHNPALRKAVIDHAIWMIQEYNFDGFRADALKHMADSFVTDFKAAIVKHIETTVSDHDSPDQAEVFYIVGESLGGWARYHTRADMVQGQVNEGFSDSIQHHIFADGSIGDLTHWASSDDASYLTEQPTLENGKGGYPGAVMGNFFGNHDKVRALTHAGGDHKKLRLAQTFLMTAPINIPMLYQGDDIGMLGGPDPDNRRPMKFGNLTRDESASLDHIRKLGLFRARNRPLRYGKRSVCDASYDAAVFTLTHDDETVVVGLNRGSAPFAATCAGLSGTFKDLAGNAVTISDGKITVPAQSSIALGK
jgi:glycosidase